MREVVNVSSCRTLPRSTRRERGERGERAAGERRFDDVAAPSTMRRATRALLPQRLLDAPRCPRRLGCAALARPPWGKAAAVAAVAATRGALGSSRHYSVTLSTRVWYQVERGFVAAPGRARLDRLGTTNISSTVCVCVFVQMPAFFSQSVPRRGDRHRPCFPFPLGRPLAVCLGGTFHWCTQGLLHTLATLLVCGKRGFA